MTNSTNITNPSTLVAINIAKRQNDVLVQLPDATRKSYKVANTLGDYCKFTEYLRSLPTPCLIAFEPTADYHRTVAWHLLDQGFDLRLVSSVACARSREAISSSRDKNDPRDTKVILHLLESGITQRCYDPLAHGHHDLQELVNTYSVIVFLRTQALHSLKNHYQTLYFPEIQAVSSFNAVILVYADLSWISDASLDCGTVRVRLHRGILGLNRQETWEKAVFTGVVCDCPE